MVCALEIIEHVSSPGDFVQSVLDLAAPDGLVIFSTLNRSLKSWALGIVAAEYILQWLPKGTHQWKKFIRPSELSSMIRKADGTPEEIKGLVYNPFKQEFYISDKDLGNNYILCASKTS